MSNFFEKNKIPLAIIIGALIIGVAVYFALKNPTENQVGENNQADESVPATSTNQCLAPQEALVTKIIDGDTIVVEGGYHVRILSIDADEKGYPCYDEASKRLGELILNKKVRLEKDISDVDQYKRCLRYVFLGQQDIGLEMVKEGLAIVRFYEPDIKYKKEITLAEKTAMENNAGCKWGAVKSIVQEVEY